MMRNSISVVINVRSPHSPHLDAEKEAVVTNLRPRAWATQPQHPVVRSGSTLRVQHHPCREHSSGHSCPKRSPHQTGTL